MEITWKYGLNVTFFKIIVHIGTYFYVTLIYFF